MLGCLESEVIFLSGGSEANNFAVKVRTAFCHSFLVDELR